MASQHRRPRSQPDGAKTGKVGPRHDNVGPIKTKNWPDVPGKTQPKIRNFGMKKMCQGLADKGV